MRLFISDLHNINFFFITVLSSLLWWAIFIYRCDEFGLDVIVNADAFSIFRLFFMNSFFHFFGEACVLVFLNYIYDAKFGWEKVVRCCDDEENEEQNLYPKCHPSLFFSKVV